MSDDPALFSSSYAYTESAALLAERMGFDTLLLAEHFINPLGPDLDQLDAWSTAAALAAVTERIEIIAAVKPGLRAPGVVAKMGANIDRISRGRFAINLVSAWWLPEYEMLGAEALTMTIAMPERKSTYRSSGGFGPRKSTVSAGRH